MTDFGTDNFDHWGAVLFTARNGSIYDSAVGIPYAEKYIFIKEGREQEIPMHYRISKTEDIINRAGDLMVGERSKISDDNKDNVFATHQERFCGVEEDEAPYRLLCNEYPKAK